MSAFFAQSERAGPTARTFTKVPDVGRDTSDPVAFFESREQRVRENYVAIEHAKILREQLIQCYRTEGVNHIQYCQDIAAKYKHSIRGCKTDQHPRIPALPIPAAGAGGSDDE